MAYLVAAAAPQPSPPDAARMRFVAWTPGIQPTWTVPQIRAVLREHEQGLFARSAQLVDAMGRDDRLTAILRHRVRGLLGMPFRMRPTDEEDERATEFAREWETLWPAAAPAATLARLLQDYILLGVAVAQKTWEKNRDGKWSPRLYREHPAFLYFDESDLRYRYQTRAGTVAIEPSDERWMIFEAGERGYMNGAVRALALLWFIRDTTWADWGRYNERHGLPLLKAKAPAQIRDDVRDAFWEQFRKLGRETSLLLPQGIGPNGESFDVDLLEASDRNWTAFEGLQKAAGTSMAIYLLGQNLTTEVDAGSFAAASVHKNVKTEVLQADERELGDDLWEQFVKPASEQMRLGGRELAPRPTWDTTPPEDRAAAATTIRTAVATLNELGAAGFEVANVVEFGRRFGVELREPEVSATPPTPPPAQPSADEARQPTQTEPARAAAVAATGTLVLAPTDLASVVRVNEARASVGLPPLPGTEGELTVAEFRARRAADAGGGEEVAKSLREAEAFNDRLAAEAGFDVGRALAPDLERILKIIETASSFEEVRAKVLAAYDDLDEARLAKIMEQALALAELNGMDSIPT